MHCSLTADTWKDGQGTLQGLFDLVREEIEKKILADPTHVGMSLETKLDNGGNPVFLMTTYYQADRPAPPEEAKKPKRVLRVERLRVRSKTPPRRPLAVVVMAASEFPEVLPAKAARNDVVLLLPIKKL